MNKSFVRFCKEKKVMLLIFFAGAIVISLLTYMEAQKSDMPFIKEEDQVIGIKGDYLDQGVTLKVQAAEQDITVDRTVTIRKQQENSGNAKETTGDPELELDTKITGMLRAMDTSGNKDIMLPRSIGDSAELSWQKQETKGAWVLPLFFPILTLFVLGEELKVAEIEAAFVQEGVSATYKSVKRIAENTGSKVGVTISHYGYLHSDSGLKDLISVGIRLDYSGQNPLGGISGFKVDQKVRARAFTGLDRRGDSGESGLSDYDQSKIVYVFPDRGEKYHNKSCPFLNPASQMVFLTSDVKRRFSSCSICHSGSATLGDIVYCFFTDGKVYHLDGCPTVDKYYVEMEKRDAEARGYTPCLTCGG